MQPYRNVIGTHERVGSRPGARRHHAHVGPWSANIWQPWVADLRGRVATRSPDKSVCPVRTHWYRISQEQHKNGLSLRRFRAELPKFTHAGVQNGL